MKANVKETSLEIYQKIKATGKLSKMRLNVFKLMVIHRKPLTAGEIKHSARVLGLPSYEHYPKRLSELEAQGVIRVVGKRECKVTRNTSQIWEVTGDMPIDYTRQPAAASKEQVISCLRKAWKAANENNSEQAKNSIVKAVSILMEL